MIEQIVPSPVATAAAYDDPADAYLFPEEEAEVRSAVEERRREFATVRWCARTTLAELQMPAVPIPVGERGAPRWPGGVVGSMTHCKGYRAAAVARATDMVTVGIDAEPHEPLPDGVLEAIAGQDELAWTRALAGSSPEVCWDRLLFSAKESVYKAWYPITKTFLDFHDASVVLHRCGTFTARMIPAQGTFRGFVGRWAVSDDFVVTAVTVPR